MVDVTIYVEGKQSDKPPPEASAADNSPFFRENFHKLFSQKLSPSEFNLRIVPFGTVTQAGTMLGDMERLGINGALLIDLDGPRQEKDERLRQNYETFDTNRIFFMIQEMEAWILSQVDKIEKFGKNERLVRKKSDQDIHDNPLLKNKHPEEIEKPSQTLDTILRQYFDVVKITRNRKRKNGKRYSKAKDSPKLIGLLDLEILMKCFDEAKRLIDYIKGEKRAEKQFKTAPGE
jgi:hypothetical protein